LIQNDLDNNKFVDCAVSASAEFIVTHDKHFSILKSVEFPSVSVISLEGFKELLDMAN